MGNSWIIRLYDAEDYSNQKDIIGDFEQYHNRQEDDVVVFSGMYGIGDYFIWYMHKNIGGWDYSTVNIDLSLYLDGDSKKTFWRRQYKILDIKYDASESKYVLFGISLDSAKLQTKLVDYGVTSLYWKKNRTPKDVLIEILEKKNIFKVEYQKSAYESTLRNFEYRMFTFDENWSVEDFINYIADQNHFEWYVRNNTLYIGKECKAIAGMNSTRKFDLEKDNVSNTAWVKKYYGETRPMDIMSHIGKVWRCVWVKHMAGSRGGISKGCFTRRGIGTLDKENYLKTLEGQPERNLASKLFINKPYSHYITLGNIIKDEGNPIYVDQISVQKNKELYKVNEPSDIKIDRGDESKSPIFQVKERVVRSTPYLDANAGILFPSPWLEEEEEKDYTEADNKKWKGNPPNSIIFQVKGKEEASVIGPYVMGNSEEDFKAYKIPFKSRKDFRMSFPKGWTMYVDGYYGQTIIQCDGVPASATLDEDESHFPYPGNEGKNPLGQEKTYIYMRPLDTESPTIKRNEISLNAGLGKSGEEVGSKLRVRSDEGFYFITKDKEADKEVKVEFTKDAVIITNTNGTNVSTVSIGIDGVVEVVADVQVYVEVGDSAVDVLPAKIEASNGQSFVSIEDAEVRVVSGTSEISVTPSDIVLGITGVTATLSGGVMDIT